MEHLILNPTNYTPGVNFNYSTGALEITGTATPEDSYNFFQPLIRWFDDYKSKPASTTTLIFKMEYFNTSSTVFMLRLMKGAASLDIAGHPVKIKWYYKENDDDCYEAGKDFGTLAKMDIELIAM